MKANSLSINIPSKRCTKNCPYCISKMTGRLEYSGCDNPKFVGNIRKVRTVSMMTGINSVIITGKGEPTDNLDAIFRVVTHLRDFPIELQTNGQKLQADDGTKILEDLSQYVNTIAISVGSKKELSDLLAGDFVETVHRFGLTLRVTANLSDMWVWTHSLFEIIDICRVKMVDQLSFRKLSIPEFPVDTEEAKDTIAYIERITNLKHAEKLLKSFGAELVLNSHESTHDIRFIRNLNFGASIYMVDGVSVSWFDNCIQETNVDSDEIRSLVYWEDGHLSTSWYGSQYGRLF